MRGGWEELGTGRRIVCGYGGRDWIGEDHGRATMNVQDTPYKSVCRKSVK